MREGLFTTVGEFEALVDQRMKDAYPDAKGLKLLGVLFMREGQTLADKEILPSLGYFNRRSTDIDFYLPGWRYEWSNATYSGVETWRFSLEDFIKAQEALEAESIWKYTGGVDLLLMTARMEERRSLGTYSWHLTKKYVIDLTGILSIPVHTLVKSNLIEAPEILFERIFRFAKVFKGNDPLLGLMEQEVRVSAITGIIDSIFGLLPKDMKKRLDYAKHFAIKDVSRKETSRRAIVTIDEQSHTFP